ncbi:hypothetical protein EJB05_14810 [Eragrostis curvula]|uniref:Uncharacterized protein n=1 Tax=Eragrostis curvula TaxID=38414 RepID=A0A5J9W1A8_9POAL|nr:hypothetical protein EJB05_14810 [Eragrostis curvula]
MSGGSALALHHFMICSQGVLAVAVQTCKYCRSMSRLAGSARWASATAFAIFLGGLVLVSLVVERSAKAPSLVSFAAEGGRRMLIGANERLADQRTLEDFRDDDPFNSSKRKVPNGPDPIHNRGTGESGRSPGRT